MARSRVEPPQEGPFTNGFPDPTRIDRARQPGQYRQVIVDGRVLIDAGRCAHGDEAATTSAAAAAIGRICDFPEAQTAFKG
jgi:hypothetical protein